MDAIYERAIEVIVQSFHILEKKAGAPQFVPIPSGFGYRYEEQSLHQAIIQKLARIVTGLQALSLLNKAGFLQEQAAVQRMLDEFEEDVQFLSHAVIFDDFTEHHSTYLDYFYQEEFDNSNGAIESSQKRGAVPRKKIRAYVCKDRGAGYHQSSSIEVARTLHKTYSGFVHGASPHIMDLYSGNPPHFQLRGVTESSLLDDYTGDLLNYYYRAILAFGSSAKAFGEDGLCDEILTFAKRFATSSGRQDHLRQDLSS